MSGKDGGWPLPETINPENEICVTLNIPDEPRYIAAFWGALYELTYWNNWQRDPSHKGAQVAAVWKSIWLYYSGIQGDCEAMCCCPEPLKRVLPDGTVQTSTDGGLTWQNTPSADPRETSIQFPPLEGEDGTTKACKAAENIVGVFQANVEQFIDDLGVLTSIAAVAAAVTSVIVIVLSGGTLLPAVTALAAALVRAGASGLTAAFTSEVWERLNCNIYCVMGENGRLELSDLAAIKAKIDEDESGIAAEILKHLIDNYGIVGMNNLTTLQGTGTGVTCGDCNCEGAWCVFLDFTGAQAQGFEVGTPHGEFGTLGASGWECEISPPNSVSLLTIGRAWTFTQITRMVFTYSNTMDTSHTNDDYLSYTPVNEGVEGIPNVIYFEEDHDHAEWEIIIEPPVGLDELYIDMKAGTFAPYGTGILHSLRIEGIGEPIEGADCE